MLARVITRLVGWAVSVFFDIERSGPPLADGPVLVTANHPNALVDPLVLFHTAGRSTRPMAKAPLFEHALVGTVLRGLGGLPVYRRQDYPDRMHLNDRTFDAAIGALLHGEAVQIYPEGTSHSRPSMAPLRTGAARIALMAEARADWGLGLRVQPVGLTYTRKHLFRGRAVASFGDPIEVGPFRDLFEADERDAARALTEQIRIGLEARTLNFDEAEDRELVEVAERLYAREKGLARPRERDAMVERMPRLRLFADALRRLGAEDPERLASLRHSIRRYRQLLTMLGVTEGDVPARYKPGAVAWYAVQQLLGLILGLPVAVVGTVAWFVPYMLTGWAVPKFRPEFDQISTYKIAFSIVVYPVWMALIATAFGLAFGLTTGVGTAVVLPLVGLGTIAWRDRRTAVLEDVRVFLRSTRRRDARERLTEMRRRLVEEFDAIADDWRASETDTDGRAGTDN